MKDTNISIIIATYNRSKILQKTLNAFLNLDVNNINYEIIIADNNSNDDTRQIVHSYSDKLPIKYFFEKRQGKNIALNAALEFVAGDIVVFTDDDITPETNWLFEILCSCNKWPDINIFGGRVIPVFPEDANKKIIQSSFSDFMFTNHNPFPDERLYDNLYPVGPNCWIKKSLFISGEKFDVKMGPTGKERISGGEIDFFHRQAAKGEKMLFIPSAIVGHRIRKEQFSIKYLIKRAIAGGRGWVRIRDPFYNCTFLFGAPRFLYRVSIKKFLAVPYYFVIGKNYLEPLLKSFEYIGCIYEYRNLQKTNTNKGD